MKYKSFGFFALLILATITLSFQSSCKAKEGCGLEEKYNNPDMKSKGGKSNLFSKSHRKKMKRS
ncbi:MAG: hypothetical protein IPN79_07670 [Saprospiraceae bacterium]|nr:hypothetical protein [Saprospiraceae bacterium]